MRRYKLFSTGACHLCEMAQAMIAAECPSCDEVLVEEVDIANSDTLFKTYGVRIPVLQHPDGRELNWPFSQVEVREFLLN